MVRYDKSAADKGAKYVDDRRRKGRRSAAGGARSGGVGKVGGGLGGILIVILGLIFGTDLTGGGGGGSTGAGIDIGAPGFDNPNSSAEIGTAGATGSEVPDPDADTVEFMQFLMADTQEVWAGYFAENDLTYRETRMVIFEDSVQTGCGNATSAVGPFYCPAPNDGQVYVDLDFYRELSTRFGAPGDFAQAYVVAHEVGHHIQSVTGISDGVRQVQSENPGLKNEFSVRQELQADCFAGVWAHSASERTTSRGLPIIERGDIEEGLAAAASVGDDRIQQQAGMTVDPHSWTHGSAAARQFWFRMGLDNGDPNLCDTYSVPASEVGL